MTFYECLMECAGNQDLVDQFNRLTGRKVGVADIRSPLDRMIDKASGYEETLTLKCEDDLRAFIDFCYEAVWARLPRSA